MFSLPGLGSHLSLYVVVMPGENDGALRWPMMEIIRVMLFDRPPEGKAIKLVNTRMESLWRVHTGKRVLDDLDISCHFLWGELVN